MVVLGFDTATPSTAVGLTVGEEVLEARDDPSPGDRPGHSTRLLGLAHELLRRAGLHWADVQRIGVGVGPGTFTGLRIGVASARGLAHSLGAELVAVSSLQALAVGAQGHESVLAAGAHRHESVLAVIDARRGEAFLAAYRARHEALSPRVLAPNRFQEAVDALEQPTDWLAVGDGAVRFAEALVALGVQVAPTDSSLHRISGAAVCRLAAAAPSSEGLEVVPHYGRAPDAQPAQRGRASAPQETTDVPQTAGTPQGPAGALEGTVG